MIMEILAVALICASAFVVLAVELYMGGRRRR
jgi:hypothetical protein